MRENLFSFSAYGNSPVQLDWFVKGGVLCGLPVHAPKRLLGIIQKEWGNLPGPCQLVDSTTYMYANFT
jgi:hypothetical protein